MNLKIFLHCNNFWFLFFVNFFWSTLICAYKNPWNENISCNSTSLDIVSVFHFILDLTFVSLMTDRFSFSFPGNHLQLFASVYNTRPERDGGGDCFSTCLFFTQSAPFLSWVTQCRWEQAVWLPRQQNASSLSTGEALLSPSLLLSKKG